MEDAPPVPSPLSIRQSYSLPRGEGEEEEEEEDVLTPLLQSRRPSRQYVSISPPPGDSSLPKRCPPRTEALPSFTNPWSSSSIVHARSLASQQQAGSSAPRVPPLIHIRDESPGGGDAREACLSVVSEDAVHVAGLPLTGFPPWTSNSDREREGGDPRRERAKSEEEGAGCRCDDGRARKGVVHAAVLAAQFVAFTGLFCVWVDVAVREAAAPDSGFWHRLWVYFQPVLGGLGLFAAAAMLAYEAGGLSDAVFLGVQAVVMVVAGAAGFCVVWWALETGSRAVVGAAAGTAVMMLGVGVFGFARAAVVWWLERELLVGVVQR